MFVTLQRALPLAWKGSWLRQISAQTCVSPAGAVYLCWCPRAGRDREAGRERGQDL